MPPAVVLLKEASAPPDAYQSSLSSRNFNVSFLAPLRFRFSSSSIDRVSRLLASLPAANNIAALVATSPRGIDAFLMAMKQVHDAASSATADSASAMPTVNDGASSSVQPIAEARGSMFSASLAQWSHRPFFVIGSESAKRFVSDPLAQLYGFHATTFDGVVNASQLGMRIRIDWKKICETFVHRYAEEIPAAAAMSSSPSLLALVGDKRRDELFEVLTAAEINRSPTPIFAPTASPHTRTDSAGFASSSSAPSSPRNPSSARNSPRTATAAVVVVGDLNAHQGSNVSYREETVYETVTADVPTVREKSGAAIEPTPFMQQFLHILHSIYSAPPNAHPSSPPQQPQPLQQLQSPIYIVFFSPSGVETFFAQLEYHKSVLEEQRQLLFLNLPSSICPISSGLYSSSAMSRFQFVAIGGTTAAAFNEYHERVSPLSPSPPLLVSEKPNPEALSTCIDGAWKRMATASLIEPISTSIPKPRSLQHIPFYKYHGTLNDYVLIDGFVHASFTRSQLSQIARELCADRRGAIGSDGLLFVSCGREKSLDNLKEFDEQKQHVQGRMYMWNTDGSEAEMCGNGLRCCVKFIYDHKYQGLNPSSLCVLTGAGEKIARVTPDEFGLAKSISLQLGQPRVTPELHYIEVDGWTLACHDISMGNPHCIVLLEEGKNPLRSNSDNPDANNFPLIYEMDAHKFGKALHDNLRYTISNGCNISFVSVRPPAAASSSNVGIPFVATVDIRTYERGNGETWSCGSGISASVCSVLCRRAAASSSSSESRTETVQVFVKGGELAVTCQVNEIASPSEFVKRTIVSVELSGPATEVFQGSFPIVLNS